MAPDGADRVDDEPIEITCHDCGKTWQHAGTGEQATCPACGETTPVEGTGP